MNVQDMKYVLVNLESDTNCMIDMIKLHDGTQIINTLLGLYLIKTDGGMIQFVKGKLDVFEISEDKNLIIFDTDLSIEISKIEVFGLKSVRGH